MSTLPPVVYWHRDLPPLDAEIVDEHVIEAASDRVAGLFGRDSDAWDACHASLMAHVRVRLEQEVARLGGDFAHVIDEHIDSRRDDVTTESWLQGRFTYVLCRRVPGGLSGSGR